MTMWSHSRRALIALVALVALIATLGSTSTSCGVEYKPQYAPILASINSDGDLTVSYDASYVTPIGTFTQTGAIPLVDLEQGDTLLEIRHQRLDSSEKVTSLFRVRNLDKSRSLTVIGGSGVQVSGDRATTTIDVPPDAREFTIAVDDPAAVKAPEANSMSTWSEPPPVSPPTSTELPTTTKPAAQPLRMPIDGVRSIPGRGTMVTGKIQQGDIKTGDSVVIVAPGRKPISSVAIALEMSGKRVDRARSGDTVGVLLGRVNPTDVGSGHVLQAL